MFSSHPVLVIQSKGVAVKYLLETIMGMSDTQNLPRSSRLSASRLELRGKWKRGRSCIPFRAELHGDIFGASSSATKFMVSYFEPTHVEESPRLT